MSDFRDIVGDDPSAEELERLARVDRLLRSVPAPPAELPPALARSVALIPLEARFWTRRRTGAAAALAAAIAGLSFGLGTWVGGGSGLDARRVVAMRATENAAGATALIRLAPKDESTGNWQFELVVAGLPRLPPGGYYVLWLAKDGRYAATCGTFNVGGGETRVRLNASYRLADYDRWVITAQQPGQALDSPHPWLLEAPV